MIQLGLLKIIGDEMEAIVDSIVVWIEKKVDYVGGELSTEALDQIRELLDEALAGIDKE